MDANEKNYLVVVTVDFWNQGNKVGTFIKIINIECKPNDLYKLISQTIGTVKTEAELQGNFNPPLYGPIYGSIGQITVTPL